MERMDPMDPMEPMERMERMDPMEPMERMDPMELMEPTLAVRVHKRVIIFTNPMTILDRDPYHIPLREYVLFSKILSDAVNAKWNRSDNS